MMLPVALAAGPSVLACSARFSRLPQKRRPPGRRLRSPEPATLFFTAALDRAQTWSVERKGKGDGRGTRSTHSTDSMLGCGGRG